MQAVQTVQKGDASTRAHCMAALGEWLVQQGTAKEAGKEILMGATALLEPAPPDTPKGILACSLSTCSTAICLQHCKASCRCWATNLYPVLFHHVPRIWLSIDLHGLPVVSLGFAPKEVLLENHWLKADWNWVCRQLIHVLLGPAVQELLSSTTLASAATADANDDATLNASKGAQPSPTKTLSPEPDNAAPQQMKVRGEPAIMQHTLHLTTV